MKLKEGDIMITLQHILATFLSDKGNYNLFKDEIAYALLPDSIRAYLRPRQYSHFEESSDKKDISWLEYPLDLNNITKENTNEVNKHLSENILPCCLGEKTILSEFYKHNQHLPDNYYNGVEKHLIQDMVFDNFIRDVINCDKKYDDIFIFNDKKLNGKEVRNLIANIEKQGFYVLAERVYKQYNITTNQQWFDKNVKPILYETYSEDLANNTYKFIKVDPQIDELISSHTWPVINTDVDIKEYNKMYDEMLNVIEKLNIQK